MKEDKVEGRANFEKNSEKLTEMENLTTPLDCSGLARVFFKGRGGGGCNQSKPNKERENLWVTLKFQENNVLLLVF